MIRDHDRVNRTALSGCIDETSRRRMGAPASIPEAVLANLARACDAYFSVSSHAKPHEGGDMGDVRDLTAASYPGLDIMAASVHPSCLRSMRGLMGVFCSRLAVAKQRATRGEGGEGRRIQNRGYRSPPCMHAHFPALVPNFPRRYVSIRHRVCAPLARDPPRHLLHATNGLRLPPSGIGIGMVSAAAQQHYL